MSGVHVVRDGGVATLIIDNPGKRNAISEAMWLDLPRRLGELADDAGIRAVIVRGEGADFSAGADIGEFGEVFATTARAKIYMSHFARAQETLAAFPKPTIAAITGACVGGGCGLALACDIRFAAVGARLGVTPTRLGVIYALSDTRRLIDAVGYSTATDLLFTGRLVVAGEALALGLVNRVVAADVFAGEVAAYADRIATAAPSALVSTKRVITMLKSDAGAAAEAEALFFAAIEGDEFAEGRAAFLAGRKPVFV